MLVIGNVENKPITLLNIYNLPGQDSDFMRKMLSMLVTEARGMIIMGGDFNMVMNAKDTQSKEKHKSEKTAVLLWKVEREMGSVDI